MRVIHAPEMDVCHAAAWVYWFLEQSKNPEGMGLLREMGEMEATRESPPECIWGLRDLGLTNLEALSVAAEKSISPYRPVSSTTFAKGWEHWIQRDDGEPDLVGRWALVIAILSSLRYPLEKLPIHPTRRESPPVDLKASGCGIFWWELVQELPRLRWAMGLAADALPIADKLPEQYVRLQDRWRSQAFTLLEELKIQFGGSLDIPPFQGNPAVVGARLVPLRSDFIADLDKRVDRMRSLGAALQVYVNAENQSAIPVDQWRSAGWICKGIEEFNAAGEKMTANKLDRLAMDGLINRRRMKGTKRQWEYQLASICGCQRLRWTVEALKQAFLSESDVARRGRGIAIDQRFGHSPSKREAQGSASKSEEAHLDID